MVVSGYTFGIFWSLHSLFFFFQWWFLVTPLVSFGLCILSSSSSNGGLWLHLWYLQTFPIFDSEKNVSCMKIKHPLK
jgi:hypothetical protein